MLNDLLFESSLFVNWFSMYEREDVSHVNPQLIRLLLIVDTVVVFLFNSLQFIECLAAQDFLVNFRNGSSIGKSFQQQIAFISNKFCNLGVQLGRLCPSPTNLSANSLFVTPECAFTLIMYNCIVCIVISSLIAFSKVQLLYFLCAFFGLFKTPFHASIAALLSV